MPRWPAAAALLAVGALYAAVSTELTPGPQLLVPVLVALLVAALMSAHVGGRRRLARRFALALVALVTVAVATSALLLILVSLGGGTPAPALLGDAALIWAMNVVTFAVWYWEIDGGGPASHHRDRHYSERLPLPPDGARRGGGARLIAGLHGLPLPRIQHQHGLQPHGHGDPQSASEGAHDGPVGRLAGGRRRANRSRRQRARLHGIGHLRIAALPRRYHLQASFAEFDLGVILSSMVSRQISLL